MSRITPQEMAKAIGAGLLSFPVTPFKPDFAFDEKTYRSNLDWLCSYDVAGLFSAGGTGEMFSLAPAGGKQARYIVTAEPIQVRTIGLLVERKIRLEGRDGEGQQPRTDCLRHLLWRDPAHAAASLER